MSWVVGGSFFLVTVRAWSFLALVALVEVIWVGVVVLFSFSGLVFNELAWLFWAGVIFFFSAAELVMALSLFLTSSLGGKSWLGA